MADPPASKNAPPEVASFLRDIQSYVPELWPPISSLEHAVVRDEPRVKELYDTYVSRSPVTDGVLRVETRPVSGNYRGGDTQSGLSRQLLAAAVYSRYPNGLPRGPNDRPQFTTIHTIECDDRSNPLRSLEPFYDLRLLFPDIRRLVLVRPSGDLLTPSTAAEFARDGIAIETPCPPPPPTAPALPTHADDPHAAIRMLGEFPAVPFLLEFVGQCGQPDGLYRIERFYRDTSVFSLSCDYQVPYFEQFSRNLLDCQYADRSPQGKFVCGANAIREAQYAIFAGQFRTRVAVAHAEVLGDDVFAVVLHGLFAGAGMQWLGYDRSLVILREAESGVILNDELHVRELGRFAEFATDQTG